MRYWLQRAAAFVGLAPRPHRMVPSRYTNSTHLYCHDCGLAQPSRALHGSCKGRPR